MPWKCFKLASIRQGPWEPSPGGGRMRQMYYTLPDGREVNFDDLPVGAMWHTDLYPEDPGSGNFYRRKNSICVVLPGKTIWYMNFPGTNGHVWDVRGEIPDVTASPSINFVGLYHGYVRDGVV